MAFKKAKWIVPNIYKDFKPLNIFHKENERVKIETPDNLKNLHYAFRRFFELPRDLKKVKISVTADDYYKLYCNGNFVGMGPAQGYYFDYYWNEFDLTDYLLPGKNEIFADVYYHGLISRSYTSGDKRLGFLAEVTDESGEIIVFTDKNWETGKIESYLDKKVIGYDTAFCENYDARLENIKFGKASEIKTNHILHSEPTETLEIYEQKPVFKETLENGGLFLDFGQEITAHLKITAEGEAGKTVRILHGEETENTPLKTRFKMRCNCEYDETFTLKNGINTRTQYDYKAFRYVTLIPDENVKILEVSAVVRHFPFKDICEFNTNDEKLKKVWNLCKNTVKFGAQEIFVDCPAREKGQYAGDLTVTSAAHLILTKDIRLFKKALDNQMQSAKVCKGLLAVTPGSLMQEIADYSLQFPILALRHYHFTKDRDYLLKCYDVCCGILEHFKKFSRKDGLICGVSDKWNLVDWPENLRDGYDFRLSNPISKDSPPHNVLNAFYIGATLQTEEIAEILGIKREKYSLKLILAFNNAFYNPDTHLYCDCEISRHSSLHSNVIPAFYGFCKEESREEIARLIISKGLCCGVYMAYFVLKALCKLGYHSEAYSLIINESDHSWLNMIKEGATTCFEAWGKDQKANTSLCHPWASAPISVIAEDILPTMPWLGEIKYNLS